MRKPQQHASTQAATHERNGADQIMGAHRTIDASSIRKAAYRLAEESGLSSVSVRSVAAACGVSVGSIYNYYPSKDDLVIDVVSMIWQEVFHDKGRVPYEHSGFVDFAEHAAQSIDEALASFREDWLPEIHALGIQARSSGKLRELQSFDHMRTGLLQAYEQDERIDRMRIEASIDPERLCSLVLRIIVGADGCGRSEQEAFFSLLRIALYPA